MDRVFKFMKTQLVMDIHNSIMDRVFKFMNTHLNYG